MANQPRSTAIVASLLMMTVLSESLTLNETTLPLQSGFLHLGRDRRLTMPPGSVMVLTPTLSLPMGRDLPLGYGASITISIPFKIGFDDLGLTSNENTWGIIGENDEPTPGDLAGGDREVMYNVVQDSLQSVGLNGKACLLRAICEMFELPLPNHGFVGEILELFFSASKTPRGKNRMLDYTEAEKRGKNGQDCTVYHAACPFSFFDTPAGNSSVGINGNN